MDAGMDAAHMKKVLLIAYHYPPLRGSSGIQRALRFSQYLSDFGWQPIVLTAHPRAYSSVAEDQMGEIPNSVPVERAFALDAAKHLAISGRYWQRFALPDRWASWWFGGVWSGLRLIREYRPDLIWSTYPIATAHKIGFSLARRSGLPWVADFRDPMAQPGYPSNPATWQAFKKIETKVLTKCDYATFTSPGAIAAYRQNYPDLPANKLLLLENGYDEEVFSRAALDLSPVAPLSGRPIKLLHSGIIYPSERDPRQLFEALARLKTAGVLTASHLQITLRATANDLFLQPLIEQHGIADMVQLAPPIGYQQALREMMSVDGLLVLQAANCNGQIPAKLYEYLRAGPPVIALTDPQGDTAGTLLRSGVDAIARLDRTDEIADLLQRFVEDLATQRAKRPDPVLVAACSRRERTRQLADLFEQVMQGRAK